MADEEESKSGENERNDDLVSYLYVLGGIPTLIAFFLILFLLVGSCDQANVMIPACRVVLLPAPALATADAISTCSNSLDRSRSEMRLHRSLNS